MIPMLENVIRDIKMISNTTIIKYDRLAKVHETLDTKRNFDYYFLAITKKDSFNTHPYYSSQVLVNAGIGDPELIIQYVDNKHLIPEHYRDAVLNEQRKYLIETFEELNNYYRELNGKPNLEDTQYFYVDEKLGFQLSIPTDVPIHLLSNVDVGKLYAFDFIPNLINQYPDKKYLSYLGERKIDVIRARMANNFAIMRVERINPDNLFDEFVNTYEQMREYFMTAVYNQYYSNNYKYYDNTIAFYIMIATLQKIFCVIFKNGIERDFFDINSIKLMFDAYGVPFVHLLSMAQHRILLQNLNNLFRLKATDKVIIELTRLMGFTNIEIYRYYLVKEHITDIHGDPVFIYKDVVQEDGSTIKVLDREKTYRLYFNTVHVGHENVSLALTDDRNNVDYYEVTSSDPYWWEDEDTKREIYDREFNYIETKYMSFNIMYKMSKMVFETIYFFSMLHDRKDDTEKLSIYIRTLFGDKSVSLFHITIVLFALMAKKNKMAGNIIYNASGVATVMGFNFKTDFKQVIEDIKNDKDLDNDLITFIENMSLATSKDVNRLYKDIRSFKYFIENKLVYTSDKNVYDKYMAIFKQLMVTEYMSEIFELPDGTCPKTYLEYLKMTKYDLFKLVDDMEPQEINKAIPDILYKLQELYDSLKYIHMADEGITTNMEALLYLINFFKSYTIDIRQFNLIYIIDDRIGTNIKFTERHKVEVDMDMDMQLHQIDALSMVSRLYGKENLDLICSHNTFSTIRLPNAIAIYDHESDKISKIEASIKVEDQYDVYDRLKKLEVVIRGLHSNIDIKDVHVGTISVLHQFNKLLLEDLCKYIKVNMKIYNNHFSKDMISKINILIKISDTYVNMDSRINYINSKLNIESLDLMEDEIKAINTDIKIGVDIIDMVSNINRTLASISIDSKYSLDPLIRSIYSNIRLMTLLNTITKVSSMYTEIEAPDDELTVFDHIGINKGIGNKSVYSIYDRIKIVHS